MNKLSGIKFHFIGVGGIGMSGLAELLHNLGAVVSGSDLKANNQTQHLESVGVKVFLGHHAKNVGEIDVVVYSSAVKKDNVEYVAARERKIPVIPRAEALAEIMHLKRGIAIAGTHGKTTTTSLCASVFLEAGLDPTIAVGGRLDIIKSTAKLGTGEWLVAEADESDGSFHRLSPEIAVITNIDNDHMDHYQDFSRLQQAFWEFALKIPFYGTAIVCGDDPLTKDLFLDFPKKILFYGFDKSNDYLLFRVKEKYQVTHQGELFCEFSLPMPGDHNALNATAALLAGHVAGIDFKVACQGIQKFRGVDRRFQLKGLFKGDVPIYDDYGHHPTEIKAVLKAFKERYPDSRLNVLFQPHRFSRLQICWQEFLEAFDLADQLYVLPVYAAGEKSIPGVDSETFCRELKVSNIQYVSGFDELFKILLNNLQTGDVCVTLGAGDVWKLGEQLCQIKSH